MEITFLAAKDSNDFSQLLKMYSSTIAQCYGQDCFQCLFWKQHLSNQSVHLMAPTHHQMMHIFITVLVEHIKHFEILDYLSYNLDVLVMIIVNFASVKSGFRNSND